VSRVITTSFLTELLKIVIRVESLTRDKSCLLHAFLYSATLVGVRVVKILGLPKFMK